MTNDETRLPLEPAEPVVVTPASDVDGETVAGAAIGTAGGAALGAAVGALGGPVGAVIGAAVGGIAGGVAGAAVTADDGTVPTTTTPITGNAGYGADVDTGLTGTGITPPREIP